MFGTTCFLRPSPCLFVYLLTFFFFIFFLYIIVDMDDANYGRLIMELFSVSIFVGSLL